MDWQFCIDGQCKYYEPQTYAPDQGFCQWRMSPELCKRIIASLENDEDEPQ